MKGINVMSNKYKLTKETKMYLGRTLYRIKALKSFSNVTKGDLGGFIQNESNLSQYRDCWVHGNACVSGNARVSGDNKVTVNVFTCNILKDYITVTDKNISIGCENHTFAYWLKNVKKIGKDNNYTKTEINEYHDIIKILIKQMKRQLKNK